MRQRFSIFKIVSQRQENASVATHLAATMFAEAYADLRRACPDGDLQIHLSVEEPAEVAPPWTDEETRRMRHAMAADHGFDTLEDYKGDR